MKKLVLISAILMALGVVTLAQATLIDRGADISGNHLIYDPDLNITWYDYTKSGDTPQNQVIWAAGLTVNFGGKIYDDWRLPKTVDGPYVYGYDGKTTGGFNITSSEMGHLFYTELGNKGYCATDGTCPQPGYGLTNMGPFAHLDLAHYWSGTEYSLRPQDWWVFLFELGSQHPDTGIEQYNGLAVLDGDVGGPHCVPEPITVLLLGLGLVGLAGVRRKIKQ